MQTCFEAMGLPLSLTDGKEEQTENKTCNMQTVILQLSSVK